MSLIESLKKILILPLVAVVAWTIKASIVPPRISGPSSAYTQPIRRQLRPLINQSEITTVTHSQS